MIINIILSIPKKRTLLIGARFFERQLWASENPKLAEHSLKCLPCYAKLRYRNEAWRLKKGDLPLGRKQSYSHSELLSLTKRLVLEHGYDGFNLKLLSQYLPGARSTIYQYYANKDEIVAACMRRVITSILEKASALDETDSMQALQELLGIYLEEYQLHQLLSDAYKIKTSNSDAARQDIEYVEQAHETLKVQLTRLFQKAQQEGRLRDDIPLPVQVGVFFNLINTPNMMNIPVSQWSQLLFNVWMGGAKK